MSSNVVQIDQRASARAVSAEVRRKFLAERSKREVTAIRRNRMARLVATKRWWWTMIGVTTVVSISIGASALWWWQARAVVPNKAEAVAQLQPVPDAAIKATQSTMPSVAMVASGSPPIPSSPATVPVIAAAPLSASGTGRMPPGIPMSQALVIKQALLSQAGKQPVHVTTQPVAQAVQKAQPSTQYETAASSIAKVAAPAPVVAPVASPIATQAAGATNFALVGNTAYQIVGVPVDGVLQIKIGKDPAIKPIRVGERLPSGEVLRQANSDTGQIETSERSFKVN